jgi:hypothetical protein
MKSKVFYEPYEGKENTRLPPPPSMYVTRFTFTLKQSTWYIHSYYYDFPVRCAPFHMIVLLTYLGQEILWMRDGRTLFFFSFWVEGGVE